MTDPDGVTSRQELHQVLRNLFAEAGEPPLSELADRAYVSEASIRAYLNGRALPPPDKFARLLMALGVPESAMDLWISLLHRVQMKDQLERANRDVAAARSGTPAAQQEARQALSEAEGDAAAADELTLPVLWSVTHKRLDYYHQIATGQARQSFRNAQIAMGAGFVLLVGFAILAFLAKSTAAAAVTGALGATAAAFAAYISRTFVRSQESAAAHLRSYFDQPEQFSRFLAAERLLNGVERLDGEQRAAITADLLKGILPVQDSKGAEKPAAGESASA